MAKSKKCYTVAIVDYDDNHMDITMKLPAIPRIGETILYKKTGKGGNEKLWFLEIRDIWYKKDGIILYCRWDSGSHGYEAHGGTL